jgi:hypothetical protein
MDEAFVSLHQMIRGMEAAGDIGGEEIGIRMYIDRMTVETPIELDLTRQPDGTIAIGSVPPLYRVDTSLRPSFHQIRFTAELRREGNDG